MAIVAAIALGLSISGIIYLVYQTVCLLLKSKSKTINTTKKLQKSLQCVPGIPFWGLMFQNWNVAKLACYIGSLGEIIQFGIWRIRLRVAIINDYELGKEVFKNPIFNGKNTSEIIHHFSQGANGIMNTDGEAWKEQRRFCHQQLKQFGFGTKTMEKFIRTEIDEILENWSRKKEMVFSPNKEFYIPILNSIWVILAGERASTLDNGLTQLIYSVYKGTEALFGLPEMLITLQKLKLQTVLRIAEWIPIFSRLLDYEKILTDLHIFLKNTINERKKTFDPKKIPTNLLDAYLLEIQNTTDPKSGFFEDKGELNLMAVMADFYAAGGETTATTLAWAMLHLIRNQKIQDKIHSEIQLAVDKDQRPCLHDMPNCPFTEAFLMEVLRVSPVGVGNLPHVTTEDTSVGQYSIPKDTIVLLNIYNIQHDPYIWGDPQNFRPERFLSQDQKRVVRRDELVVFSLGPRRCIGEKVARDSLFLYVSAICQRFVLKPDPLLKDVPPLRDLGSAMHVPDIFNMVAVHRT